jgi:hypothetical protein
VIIVVNVLVITIIPLVVMPTDDTLTLTIAHAFPRCKPVVSSSFFHMALFGTM